MRWKSRQGISWKLLKRAHLNAWRSPVEDFSSYARSFTSGSRQTSSIPPPSGLCKMSLASFCSQTYNKHKRTGCLPAKAERAHTVLLLINSLGIEALVVTVLFCAFVETQILLWDQQKSVVPWMGENIFLYHIRLNQIKTCISKMNNF